MLDLGQIYAGGYAGFLLAGAGADVIKIEPPSGENLRRRGVVGGGAYPFAALNSNKRGISLDLKSEEGQEIFRELVTRSDVVLENFTPGVMERLGLGSKELLELNPALVYGKVSGYGADGPYRDLPAMDLTVQAMVGVMSTTGFPDRPPVKAGPAISDFLAGVHLYGGIMTGLFKQARTGVGGTIEVSMQDATFPSLMSSLGLLYSGAETESWRTGNRHSGYAEAPYNVYETSDGFIAIICVTDGHWKALARIIGGESLVEDPRFATLVDRVARMEEIDELVGAWTSTQSRDQLAAKLLETRVPCAPVKELHEVIIDPNMLQRGMLHNITHPELGPVTVIGSPLRFDDEPSPTPRPSPSLGQHTRSVLAELLEYGDSRLDELHSQGVI